MRESGARVVHAHNLQPSLGWRARQAAREAGARVVLHLHQYRLVCAVGVCFTRGQECTRCHGRNTAPGVLRNCRGSLPEAILYGASLALWQRRMVQEADAVIVPSAFAAARLEGPGRAAAVGALERAGAPVSAPQAPPAAQGAPYALVVSRLSPEKGVDVAVDACRIAGMPLVVAGEGPEREALRMRARGGQVRFVGRASERELAELRAAGAAIALAPSRSAETFGIAVAEAMAAGLPVAASRVGALPELVEEDWLVPAGDASAMARAIGRLAGDRQAGERGALRVQALCSPQVVGGALARIYDGGEPAAPKP